MHAFQTYEFYGKLDIWRWKDPQVQKQHELYGVNVPNWLSVEFQDTIVSTLKTPDEFRILLFISMYTFPPWTHVVSPYVSVGDLLLVVRHLFRNVDVYICGINWST